MNTASKLLLGGIVGLLGVFGLLMSHTFITVLGKHEHGWHMHMHDGRILLGMNSMWLVEFGLLVLIGLAIAWFVRELSKPKA
jgi:hypothetical protein